MAARSPPSPSAPALFVSVVFVHLCRGRRAIRRRADDYSVITAGDGRVFGGDDGV